MNKEVFYSYLAHPELLDDRTAADLEAMLVEYPYFQTARMLHLKNLNNQGTISYERELRKNAIWITNRNSLFYLLDKRVLLPVNETEFSEKKLVYSTFESEESIDFVALTEYTSFPETNYGEIATKSNDKNDELEQLIMSGAAQAGTFFDVDDQVNLEEFKSTFKKKKNKSVEVDLVKDEKVTAQTRRSNLIDSFIAEQPRIVPKESAENMLHQAPKNDSDVNSDMMTDTLAQIYIKQGLYEKAIHAYEKLSLKYPEKNSYFAGQIEKIKQIINNQ
jgi:tetratricopeptide (TPR) repeat protein